MMFNNTPIWWFIEYAPTVITNAYITEDASQYYITEDATSVYVTEV